MKISKNKRPQKLELIKNPCILHDNYTAESLTAHQISDIQNLFEHLQKNATVLYRGIDSQETVKVYKKDKVSPSKYIESFGYDVIPPIFYFGLKSKDFLNLSPNYLEIRSATPEGIASLIKILASKILSKGSQLAKFADKNIEFSKFYTTQSIDDLIEKLASSPENFRRHLRDQLISVLHQDGENPYYNTSLLISTSECYSVAEKFSDNENGAIIILWIPERSKTSIVYSHAEKLNQDLIAKFGFPRVEIMPHIHEHEISIFGVIFPHYIFGIYDKKTDATYINPSLFEIPENFNWPEKGLIIDQHEFEKLINDTSFKSMAVKENDGINISNTESA